MKSIIVLVLLMQAPGCSRVFASEDYRHWFKTPIMGWNDFNDMGLGSESQITNAALTFIALVMRARQASCDSTTRTIRVFGISIV